MRKLRGRKIPIKEYFWECEFWGNTGDPQPLQRYRGHSSILWLALTSTVFLWLRAITKFFLIVIIHWPRKWQAGDALHTLPQTAYQKMVETGWFCFWSCQVHELDLLWFQNLSLGTMCAALELSVSCTQKWFAYCYFILFYWGSWLVSFFFYNLK